jgi:hypothetical protein
VFAFEPFAIAFFTLAAHVKKQKGALSLAHESCAHAGGLRTDSCC